MDKSWEEELKWMVDDGILTFTKTATFEGGPYEGQEGMVEQYFSHITVTSTDPADIEKGGTVPVKTGDYEFIEGTDGRYIWKGWRE